MSAVCKICNGDTKLLFTGTVMGKYVVKYFQCNNCSFIQTEEPYWLKEAYNSVISDLDIGIIYRNIQLSNIVENIYYKGIFNSDNDFLDYGGGYGMFARMMRDKGFRFYRHDPYCDNLFAKYFDITDLPANQRFEVLTAFEVFEHLVNPKEELEKMLKFSDNIIFSTELQPAGNITPETWWYFVPESGQHISLYSIGALQALAKSFGLHLYTNRSSIHIFSRKELSVDPFVSDPPITRFQKVIRRFKGQKVPLRKESLLSKDFDYIKGILKERK